MQIFIVQEDLNQSAMELDDKHLLSTINEMSQMLHMWFNRYIHQIEVGQFHHPLYQYYFDQKDKIYRNILIYCHSLLNEFQYRFLKIHKDFYLIHYFLNLFSIQKLPEKKWAYIKGKKGENQEITNENVFQRYQNLLNEKYQNSSPKWSKRKIPDWVIKNTSQGSV